jgi:hypothetical protein
VGVIVIVAYRPKPGKEADLDALVAEHVPILRAAGLATDRAPVIAKAKDGAVVEVFEWVSPKAIELAHADETVRALWERFEDACDYVPLSELPEAGSLFSEFTPVEPR